MRSVNGTDSIPDDSKERIAEKDSTHTIDKIEEAKYLLSIMMYYRKICDDKSNIVLAIFGAIIAAIIMMGNSGLSQMYTALTNDNSMWSDVLLLILVFSVALFICGFVSLLSTVCHNTSISLFKGKNEGGAGTDDVKTSESILYFRGIAKHGYEEFRKIYLGYSDGKYLDDILEEVHITANVCIKKYRCFKIGLILSSAGMALMLFAIAAGFAYI